MSEDRVLTVGDVRALLRDLPDDDPLFVDGYEGGFAMPGLRRVRLVTLEPWVAGRPYTGPWSESRTDKGPLAWVLERVTR